MFFRGLIKAGVGLNIETHFVVTTDPHAFVRTAHRCIFVHAAVQSLNLECRAPLKQKYILEMWEYSWWSYAKVLRNRCYFASVFSTGHAQWGVSAGFGPVVAPRIVSRSHVDVTDSPQSSNHCGRMLGRWWTSLLMRMVNMNQEKNQLQLSAKSCGITTRGLNLGPSYLTHLSCMNNLLFKQTAEHL